MCSGLSYSLYLMLAEQGVVFLIACMVCTNTCTREVTSYCWVELEAYMCSGFIVLWACVYKLNLEPSVFMGMAKGVRQGENHLSRN